MPNIIKTILRYVNFSKIFITLVILFFCLLFISFISFYNSIKKYKNLRNQTIILPDLFFEDEIDIVIPKYLKCFYLNSYQSDIELKNPQWIRDIFYLGRSKNDINIGYININDEIFTVNLNNELNKYSITNEEYSSKVEIVSIKENFIEIKYSVFFEQYTFFKVYKFVLNQEEQERWIKKKYNNFNDFINNKMIHWYGKDLFLEKFDSLSANANKELIIFQLNNKEQLVYLSDEDIFYIEEEKIRIVDFIDQKIKNNIFFKIESITDNQIIISKEIPEIFLMEKIIISKEILNTDFSIISSLTFKGDTNHNDLILHYKDSTYIVSLVDWLLIFDDRCLKIFSLDDLENYINGKYVTYLVILDSIVNDDQKSYLNYIAFSPYRDSYYDGMILID